MMVHAIGDDHLEKCLDKTRQQQSDDDGDDRGEHLAILIDRRLVGKTGQHQYGEDGDETANGELAALGTAHIEYCLLIEKITVKLHAGNAIVLQLREIVLTAIFRYLARNLMLEII